MLAAPTRWALSPAVLPGTPRHYDFGEFGSRRRESIEALYEAFNAAGTVLGSDEAHMAVVDETNRAFGHNVKVYTEEGQLWSGAARGVVNVGSGFLKSRLSGNA